MNLKKLKGIRVEKGYTQDLMARKLGTTTKTYNRKELGFVEFNRREIAGLASELDLGPKDIEEIFLG